MSHKQEFQLALNISVGEDELRIQRKERQKVLSNGLNDFKILQQIKSAIIFAGELCVKSGISVLYASFYSSKYHRYMALRSIKLLEYSNKSIKIESKFAERLTSFLQLQKRQTIVCVFCLKGYFARYYNLRQYR